MKTIENARLNTYPNYSNYFMLLKGDKWGEIDTRFSFCAVMCLSLLQRLDAIDINKTVEFVLSCMNFDGGFGSKPGSESHAGKSFWFIYLVHFEKLF